MARTEARQIENALASIYEYCTKIRDYDRCDECPRRNYCFDDPDVSITEVFDMSIHAIDEFIEYADHITFREEDRLSQWADSQRKLSIEEAMIDEY